MKPDPDLSYVERAKQGDQRALLYIINKYKGPLTYKIYTMVNNETDAEDLFMESIETMYFNIHKFVPSNLFKTWLYTIAINRVIDFLRVKDRSTMYYETFSNLVLIEKENPESALLFKEKYDLLNKMVSKLKKRDKYFYNLRYVLDYDLDAIYKMTNKNEITIRTIYSRLQTKLINIRDENKNLFDFSSAISY